MASKKTKTPQPADTQVPQPESAGAKDSKPQPESAVAEGSGRSAFITLGDRTLELVLTTRATREIASRFGSIEKMADQLGSSEDVGEQIEVICWMIALLANQGVLLRNLAGGNEPEVTAEMVELLTTPGDLADYRGAIEVALARGMRRDVATPKA